MICQAVGDQAQLLLREVPEPAIAPDQVRIGVAAAGVNFADGLMLAGRYQEKLVAPFAPGLEVAGRVLELGRSCVDSAYRGRAAMQLLWRGSVAAVSPNRRSRPPPTSFRSPTA